MTKRKKAKPNGKSKASSKKPLVLSPESLEGGSSEERELGEASAVEAASDPEHPGEPETSSIEEDSAAGAGASAVEDTTEAASEGDETPPSVRGEDAAPVDAADGDEHTGLPAPASSSDTGLPSDLDVVLGRGSDSSSLEGASEEGDPALDAVEVEKNHLRGLIEALVFASDSPMPSRDVARHASAPVKRVREVLDELRREYRSRGIHLDEVAGGWTFRTSVQYAPFVRDLTKQRPVKLTRAQVEALAIIAYRQPITRPEIDDVRGVDSGPVLKVLLERDLVRILGKRDEPGRPLIYGTTPKFLEFFGLRSLKDLPTLREFTELTDESRQAYEDELGESPNAHADAGEGLLDDPPNEGATPGGDIDEVPAFAIDEPDLPHADASSPRVDSARGDDASTIPEDVPSNLAGELADIIGDSDPGDEPETIEETIDPGDDLDEDAFAGLGDDDADAFESDLEELGRQALEELELGDVADDAPIPAASSTSGLDVAEDDLS